MNKKHKIILKECKGRIRYEIIVVDEISLKMSCLHADSEKKLLEIYGELCSKTFSEVELINELGNIKQETLEGLMQMTKLNNKYYNEINRLKNMLRDEY